MKNIKTKHNNTDLWKWSGPVFKEKVRREMLLPVWDRPFLYKKTLKGLMI